MYVADIGVKCPKCGVKFSSKQMPAIIDTGYRDSEFRQDFKGKAPQYEEYAICTCPTCGKADWVNRFPVTNETSVITQRKITPHIQFRSAAVSAEQEGRDFYNIGLFYLYAAWCADDSQALPQSREYRKLAADCFNKSLVDGSCPVDQQAPTRYLIGEILRRAGEFDSALLHWQQVISMLPAEMALMSRKLMRLAEARQTQSVDFEWKGE